MLQRIESIKGIGLFHRATESARQRLAERTLVYAPNGVGKSTLASILTSCSLADSELIEERVTVDGSISPEVSLLFQDGRRINFKDGGWDGCYDQLAIYDSRFVATNVHSGAEVTSEQRRNLLDFALGTKAVQARLVEQGATGREKDANETIRSLDKELASYCGPAMKVAAFKALEPMNNVDEAIQSLESQLEAASRTERITQLPLPQPHNIPVLDIGAIFQVLLTGLDDLHEGAAEAVEAHLATLGSPEAEGWIRQGQDYDNHSTCPYCGQPTEDVTLIQMYQSHFNDEYRRLRSHLDETARQTQVLLSESLLQNVAFHRRQANERLESWREYVNLSVLGDSQDELLRTSLENLTDQLQTLLDRKATALDARIGSDEERLEMQRLWHQILTPLREENDIIESHVTRIENYKKSLEAASSEALSSELNLVRLTKKRHSPEVVALISSLTSAQDELKEAEQEKKEARGELSRLMEETLSRYRDQINRHLKNLGASFSIHELKPNYRGGAPRTDYQIKLRETPVQLSGGRPSFATALSEGDKRTMAFAFFVASTLEDAEIGKKIVVIDDPMSSLDRSRRAYTSSLITEISGKAAQVIVLAHDELFLRDLRNSWRKDGSPERITELRIFQVEGGYSDFDSVDLDELCETEYHANYRTVYDFVAGKTSDARTAAKSLRVVLEGYLHRKYPRQIPDGLTLGQAINEIGDAPLESPLNGARPSVDELKQLNNYASKFHHDTNPDHGSQANVDPQEVKSFARRVLDVIHGIPAPA